MIAAPEMSAVLQAHDDLAVRAVRLHQAMGLADFLETEDASGRTLWMAGRRFDKRNESVFVGRDAVVVGQFDASPACLFETKKNKRVFGFGNVAAPHLVHANPFVRWQERNDPLCLADLPMKWIGPASSHISFGSGEILPLATYGPPCFFRQAGIDALGKAGIAWRTAFASPSLHGLWAAIDAGLGVTLRTALGLPSSLVVLDKRVGLPAVPTITLYLHDARRALSQAANRLRDILMETLTANLAKTPGTIPSIQKGRFGKVASLVAQNRQAS